jgi:serine/threonine-protein kinase
MFSGRYRIERLVGRGATGSVWAAVDEEVGDRVALKLLVAGPDEAAERFRREVRLARRVTHRNAARIFDLGMADGVLYLTMELVDGDSLERLLQRTAPLSVFRAAEIGSQIAHGLAAAHDVGVVHRDIKPANVLVDTTGRIVLTDFGLARAVASDAKVTIGSQMIGTPSYMAPEQVRGQSVGPTTDLYALGAVMYEMLTGRCPFVADGVVATAMARLENDPEDPRRHAEIPDAVAELVLACLERLPDRRPGSAARVASALAELAGPGDGQDSAATLFAPATTTASRTPSGSFARPASATSGVGATFVTIAPDERTLAVLPFRHRGPDEHAHVAEVIAEDLVDVLTTTGGLRVSSSGATAKYEGQSVDPREAGRELGVDAIVEGTVRVMGPRLRISARLVDVATGEQLWVDRFDGALDDVFELAETTARRIAERLRVELELLGARHGTPEEAIELYLEARGRAEIAGMDDTLTNAMQLLERALEIAPDFGLAAAQHANIAVQRWFLPGRQDDEQSAREAHDSVARATELAPQLAMTHFASGRLAVNDGRFADAARELTLALSIAPTYTSAHDYLGMIQCEAGRGDEGERHLIMARELDPSLPPPQTLARRRALARDLEGYRAIVDEMRATPSVSSFFIESLEIRVAGWFGDMETVRGCRPASSIPPESPAHHYFEEYQAALLGETTVEQLLDALSALLAEGSGPRFKAYMRQLAIEALEPLDERDRAMDELRLLVDMPAFVDTDWMERCPALDSLRSEPDFAPLVGHVRRRANAIWRVQAS